MPIGLSSPSHFLCYPVLRSTLRPGVAKLFRGLFGGLVVGLMTTNACAVSFGIYDARTQALGGTAVAMGTVGEGHFYNPAITAMHTGDEDETKDGRYIFPLSITLSSAALTAVNAISDDLEQELTNAVDRFNTEPGAEDAGIGEGAARELQDAMRDLQGEDIFIDAYTGFSVSEPGDGQGGAVFVGTRVVGGGITNIADADISLLDDYIEALQFINTAGAEGVAHPELFDPDSGALINPRDDIVSSADAQALIVTEIGVSGAKKWQLWGQELSFGLAPKILMLKAFDEDWQVSNGNFESAGDDETLLQFNADIGMLAQINDTFRVGLTIKDIIPKTYETAIGNRFELEPRTRLGLAYVHPKFQLGFDADLLPNKITNTIFERQDISFGAEVSVFEGWALRAGYRKDLEDVVGQATSFGVSFRWSRALLEMAYVTGDTQEGGALQLSIVQ